jgi:hypothetical protein
LSAFVPGIFPKLSCTSFFIGRHLLHYRLLDFRTTPPTIQVGHYGSLTVTASIAVPLALTLSEPLCPTTILGTFIVPSGLLYIVLQGLRKTVFGGANVSFVFMVFGVVLERVWKHTTETWVGAGFPGLAWAVVCGSFRGEFYT